MKCLTYTITAENSQELRELMSKSENARCYKKLQAVALRGEGKNNREIASITGYHHIREYRYAYGAVSPQDDSSFFLILPYSNTDCMNVFLRELSAAYPDDYILLATDNAAWHKAKALIIPNNAFFLPPRTPELNPIEQIWKEIRKRGFKNEIFQILEKVIDRLCDTICSLSNETVKGITGREWILSML